MKIHIISPGKSVNGYPLAEYEKRIPCAVTWDFRTKWKAPEKPFIALTPRGKLFTSPEFSKMAISELVKQKGTLTFLIGPADGIPPDVEKKATLLLSLSPLTFTHQMTRLILIEQLYRAFEIEKNSPYHRD